MNVTLKLPDDLCREARHRAVDESKSLSVWIADLVAAKLKPSTSTGSLLKDLGDKSLAEDEFDLPDRREQLQRPIQFP